MLPPISFLDRVTVAMPDDVGHALRQAARAADVTVSDYVRAAVTNQLHREGLRVQRLPHLRRHRREDQP
ncbi:hypothetical protein [Heyndrickxia sporothermodurans]